MLPHGHCILFSSLLPSYLSARMASGGTPPPWELDLHGLRVSGVCIAVMGSVQHAPMGSRVPRGARLEWEIAKPQYRVSVGSRYRCRVRARDPCGSLHSALNGSECSFGLFLKSRDNGEWRTRVHAAGNLIGPLSNADSEVFELNLLPVILYTLRMKHGTYRWVMR